MPESFKEYTELVCQQLRWEKARPLIEQEIQAEKTTTPIDPKEAAAMAKAKAKGIMDGCRPNSPLTRGQFAVIMDRKGDLG